MSKIIITDGQTDEILERISKKNIIENDHEQDLSAYLETFSFTAFGNKQYAQYLTDKNRIIIPGEDGEWREFVIRFTDKYRDDETVYIEIITYASYQELVGSKIIRAGTTEAMSAEAHARDILSGTEYQVGEVAHTGLRTIIRENHTDPFSALKSLANEFDLELDFRVEIEGNNITRYADLVERVGNWNGRYVSFGKDLQSIRRKEETNPVTALLVIGPDQEDGTPLEVFVEDEDARNRWGRRGQHIVAVYEPQTEDEDITEERLRTLGRTELDKRINAVISFEANIVDLEHVPGMENKKIRFGDTVRIKDESFNPPLFVDARIYKQNRDIFNPSSKRVELGDFTEYTVEQIRENWESIREELEKKIRWLDLKGSIGNIRFTIVSYREPLKAEKSSNDSQYESLYNNPDLSASIRSNLNTAKVIYDTGYSSLISSIGLKENAEALDETDLEEVHYLYELYDADQAILKAQFEAATDIIAQKKADDVRDEVDRTNEELERAQEEINRAKDDLGEARREIDQANETLQESQERLGIAEDNLQTAREDLGKLETDLREAEESLRDKIDNTEFQRVVGEIHEDLLNKVDGEWVDGRLRVAIEDIQVGGRNLVRNTSPEFETVDVGAWGRYLTSTRNIRPRDEITARVYIKPTLETTWAMFDFRNDAGDWKQYHSPDKIEPGQEGYSTVTAVVPPEAEYVRVQLRRGSPDAPIDSVQYKEYKIEKGNKATDWTPAPEDIWSDIDTKADADNVYVKADINGMFNNTVSLTTYQADKEGYIDRFKNYETNIIQTWEAIEARVTKSTYDAKMRTIDIEFTNISQTFNSITQTVGEVRQDLENLEIGGRNIVSHESLTSLAAKQTDYTFRLTRTGSSGNPYLRVSREFFELDSEYVATFKVKKISGIVRTMAGHTSSFSSSAVYRDGVQVNTTWSSGDRNYPNDTETHSYTVNFKTPKSWPTDSAPYWYIQPNRIQYGEDYVLDIWDFQIEKGNKPTDWTPAPEDQQEFTYTQIRQLADEIDLSYAKNNELIAGIRIGDPNPINGANVEITGDTAIYGRISAPNATFLRLTTEDMTAIRTTIRDSTVTGNLNAANATIQKGSFREATIIDANIQNASITGQLNSVGGTFTGQLDGVDGTFTGDVRAGRILSNTSIDVNTDLKVGDNIYLGQSRSTAGKLISFNGIGSTVNTGILSIYSGARMNMRLFTEGYVEMLADELIVVGDLTADVLRTTGGASYGETGLYTYLRPAGNNDHSIRFTNGSGYVAILVDGNVTHAFRTDGTKIGGTIDIDGERLGMSPIDSPQILLSVLLPNVDVKAGKTTEIQLNEKFAKAIANLAVFPSQPVKIKKGNGRFTVTADEDLTVDFMIYGERTGYEGTFWLDTEEEEVV